MNFKQVIIFIAFTTAIILAFAATPGPSSSGAPASHTGAPEEKTCGAVGCHDDRPINNGTASVTIEFEKGVKKYVEGEIYSIKIKISDEQKQRFGFQIVALDSKTNTNLGTFIITDQLRTQTIKNMYQLKEREYVTYTFSGTDTVSQGYGEWTVNWKAPTSSSEPVTFYVGAVSANDDMSDKGDNVYTKSLTINKRN